MGETPKATGPDFAQGVALAEIPESGSLPGRVGDEAALLSRIDGQLYAVSATCTHYGAPLAEGLIHDGTVRCPWHHACFSLCTGEALKTPAFDALPRWKVEVRDGKAFAGEKIEASAPAPDTANHPKRILIVGGGAAGFAAAEMLRRRGYRGALTMLSEDDALPCDRPNISKDYLAGSAPEEWVFLKDEAFYREREIEVRLGTRVTALDAKGKTVTTESGETLAFDALLLATGAEPVRLPTPGFDSSNVHTLRSLADARRVIAAAGDAKRVVVIGASFIGLEAASSLRARGLSVAVISPDKVPLEKVMGPDIGAYVRGLHEQHGVTFHLGHSATGYDGSTLTLDDGSTIEADLIVQGVGVKPRTVLAEAAGLEVDNGVRVDARLQTSAPGIYAAGDIANYPSASGQRARIEHWVVAERQGQAAAAAMLGEDAPFDDVPFFWSQHYDTSIRYTGHAAKWDETRIDGSVEKGDCVVRYFESGTLRAVATIGRDHESLEAELRLT